MKIEKIVLTLAKARKRFTNYDVLFIARRSQPKTTAQEVRQITRDLFLGGACKKVLQDYRIDRTKVDGKTATIFSPHDATEAYDPEALTHWEVTRTCDKDGRLSIPRPMLVNMPLARALGITIGFESLRIHKEGTPEDSLKIQRVRQDLRINPHLLKTAGMQGKTFQIQKSHKGITITSP